jgi:hypothetical protein
MICIDIQGEEHHCREEQEFGGIPAKTKITSQDRNARSNVQFGRDLLDCIVQLLLPWRDWALSDRPLVLYQIGRNSSRVCVGVNEC